MVSVSVLKGFDLFKGLRDNELGRIAELCYVRTLDEGGRIFEEGKRATELHLCRSGKINLTIWLREPWDKNVTVHQVEPGELFGWSALVAPYAYTASAECVEAGEEICTKSSELLELFDHHPDIGYMVMRNLSAEVSARLAQTRRKLSTEWLSSDSPTNSNSWGEPRRR